MKDKLPQLPLITKLPCGTIFKVLQFEDGMAYGIDESTLKVMRYNIDNLTALTETELYYMIIKRGF